MLQALHTNLWVCEQPHRMVGFQVGARMSVVRLSSGDLLVYSPVRSTPEVRAAVDALGPVRYLLAPNRFHHVFVKQWMALYPGVETWAAPGLPEKRKDLAFTGVLGDRPEAPWEKDLDQVAWRGSPMSNEVVLLHGASRSLLCCDAVHNVGPEKPLSGKIFYGLLGGYGGFKTNRYDRMIVRDRAAARASLQRILAWDFDRVVMAHGLVLERDGREALRRAYAWLG